MLVHQAGYRGMENRLTDYARAEVVKTIATMQAIAADARLLDTVVRIGHLCAASIRAGGKVMFCGNGGSAGDSQHLAAEMIGKLVFDRPAMAGLALTVDTSALTAVGNDFGYEHVFSRQVEGLGRPGDVLIGLSTSGSSKNVIKAMQVARTKAIRTVAMTGARHGPMADLADEWLAVPHTETQKIQEGHITLGHIFCAIVEQEIHGSAR
jgi:D-sedoheptulose 7-phosphate isomerase